MLEDSLPKCICSGGKIMKTKNTLSFLIYTVNLVALGFKKIDSLKLTNYRNSSIKEVIPHFLIEACSYLSKS